VTKPQLGWGASALLLGALSFGTACDELDFSNALEIVVAPDQDPLAGASSLEVTLHYAEGEPVIGQLTVAPGVQEVAGIRPGTGVRIEVVARDYAGTPVSLGRTGPIDIGEDGIDAAVFLGTADSLARIPAALAEARVFSTILALPDEQFAVIGGGNNNEQSVTAFELFGNDPLAPLSSETLGVFERIGHQALYLPAAGGATGKDWGGQIVVIGGTIGSSDDTWSGAVSSASDSVTLLNPKSGEVTTGAAYFEAGVLGASAVLTPQGLIAVVRGIDDDGDYRETIEILLPGETFPITGPQIAGRVMQQMTPMEVGGEPRYFLSGGLGAEGLIAGIGVWDGRQTSDLLSPIGMTLGVPRARHQATALSGGRLLISGGAGNLTDRTEHGLSIPSAEIVDGETGQVWLVNDVLDVPRQRHVAVAIPGDRVLLCAGQDSSGTSLGSCEVYDSETESFSGFLGGSMSPGGAGVSAAPLPDGRVLFTGGGNASGADDSLYIYTPPDWQD